MDDDKNSLKSSIVEDLRDVLDNYNSYAKSYRIV